MKRLVDWGPGFRFFECTYCENEWSEKSRDCQSMSISDCPKCNEIVEPYHYETHYEWPVDESGNLIEGE